MERRNCSFSSFLSFLWLCAFVMTENRQTWKTQATWWNAITIAMKWRRPMKKEGANECKFIAILCTINIYSMMASNWAITNCNLHSLFSLFLLFVFFFLLHNRKSNFVVVLVCSRSWYGCWTSNFTKWFSFYLQRRNYVHSDNMKRWNRSR